MSDRTAIPTPFTGGITMRSHQRTSSKTHMQSSPWIILGSTVILLIVVIVLAVQNTNRQKESMTTALRAKGAALIRAVEAGARTGMMGMMWGGRQIQRLIEEAGRLPDVKYMAVVNENGISVAHSNPDKVDSLFRENGRKIIHLEADSQENWGVVDFGDNRRIFEVYRHFRPHIRAGGSGEGRRHGMMHRRQGRDPFTRNDWLGEQGREHLYIVVGLDVTSFEQAINKDIRTTVVMSIILLLLGFGGLVSLFWMNSYRAAKRTLEDTSAFANEVVTHLPVGVIATSRQGTISFFNAAAQRITGISAADAINHLPDEVLPGQLCALQQTLDQGRTITEKELEFTFAAGHVAPVSVSATRIVNSIGELVGYILILRDLGEVHRLQEEIRRQEKLAAIGGLAAGVAHEIRNPLSSIKGMATYLGNQFDEGSEAKEAADVMVGEVGRLNRVITELLDFSRPTELKLKSTDMNQLISHSIQLIQQDAANNGIMVDASRLENIAPVLIDPDRMSQCLLNLYLNAIQAMGQGGTLTVASYATEDAKTLHISITDTAGGIPDDLLSKIFDPYFTSKHQGTGLGLAIVHKIIEAHHGRIKVESVLGQGTTFRLCIPIQATP
jgi:two-component system sensor histidine kinase HydH